MLTLPELEIPRVIIRLVAVDVVDRLVFGERTAELAGYHQPMLKDIAATARSPRQGCILLGHNLRM